MATLASHLNKLNLRNGHAELCLHACALAHATKMITIGYADIKSCRMQ